jgi:hypothetical protein
MARFKIRKSTCKIRTSENAAALDTTVFYQGHEKMKQQWRATARSVVPPSYDEHIDDSILTHATDIDLRLITRQFVSQYFDFVVNSTSQYFDSVSIHGPSATT